MKKSVYLGALVFVVFALLVSLGTWQVKRLAWKTALIERLEQRVHQAPIPLQQVIDQFGKNEDVEYQSVHVRGTFLHDTEKHLYSLDQQGRPGWHVYTLLKMSAGQCPTCTNDKEFVYINRGFVPYTLKKSDQRRKGMVSSEVSVEGLIRLPRETKSFADVENQPLKNEWYWPSLKGMSSVDMKVMALTEKQLAPLFVDERVVATSYEWPRAGVTRINLPNRHLGYVITWYGLALALLGVYGFFLYGSERRSIGEPK